MHLILREMKLIQRFQKDFYSLLLRTVLLSTAIALSRLSKMTPTNQTPGY